MELMLGGYAIAVATGDSADHVPPGRGQQL